MYTQVSLSAVPLGCARFCLNKDQPSVTVVCSCNLCLGSHYDLAPLITAVFPSSVNLHTPLGFAGVLFLRKLLDHRQAGFPKYKSQPWAFPAWQHFQEPNQITSNFLVVQITCWTILLHRRNGGQEDLGSHFANEPFTNIFPKKLNFETIVSVWKSDALLRQGAPNLCEDQGEPLTGCVGAAPAGEQRSPYSHGALPTYRRVDLSLFLSVCGHSARKEGNGC